MNKIVSTKRFWILNFAIILIGVISFIYIAAVGGEYDVSSHMYFYSEDLQITPTYSEEGVVEYTGNHVEDGQLIFSLKALSKGSTDITFKVSSVEGDAPTFRTTVVVNSLGTIFERTPYTFNFSGYKLVILQIMIVLVIILGVMIYTVLELKKKAQYGYTMVAAGGMALFTTILIAFLAYKLMNNVVTSFSIFVSLFSETGTNFLLAMTPFMLALAVALSVSNIWLMKNEGYRPVNALGIAFSILWIVAMGISFGFMFTDILHIENKNLFNSLNKAFIYLCCYFECMLLSTMYCARSASRHTPPHDRDCIIILGCAIRKDGSPTPLLRMRTDAAVKFAKDQSDINGKQAVLVPSGGQGSDEIISEAESMHRYMVAQGVPEEQILDENRSTSTNENMAFSKEVIEKRFGDITKKKIAFATTNYHIFRGYVLARKNGFEAQGISAKTKWYFFPNAFLREFIGLLADRKLWHIMQIVVFISVFIVLGLINK